MQFEFCTANRIIFGVGSVARLAELCKSLGGSKAFFVAGKNKERVGPILDKLKAEGIDYIVHSVEGEPTTDGCLAAIEAARGFSCDCVLAVGGGSVIDMGKAVAALLTNGGEPLDYLEVIGKAQKFTVPSAPFIAVPTTAGTGAEVTANSVLDSPLHKQKCSMRSQFMLPAIALIDPQLTVDMPPDVTARTGLDALTQCIEPFLSNKANPITDAFALDGIRRAAASFQKAFENGQDIQAREDMCLCSVFGGLALANAKLGSVHGFAGPLGGMYDAPHGAICGRLLPYCLQANYDALKARSPGSSALKKMDIVAAALTNDPHATADQGIAFIERLCHVLNVPPLSAYGIKEGDIPSIVSKARTASSMQGNPIVLTDEELANILAKAL